MAVTPQRRIAELVHEFVRAKVAEQGMRHVAVEASTDVFGLGLIDSMALTELVLHVEEALEVEIDFALVDPNALHSLAGLVGQLAETSVPATG